MYLFPSLPTITPEPGLPAPSILTVNDEVIFASLEKFISFSSAAIYEPTFENDFKEVQSDMLKDIYDREELIMKSRNNLMQKVITDMSINLKDSKLDIGIPNWFTCDKKYSSTMKDGIIKEITEAAIDSMSLKYGLECNYYTIINNS